MDSSEAIIGIVGLFLAISGGLATLVFFLFGSIKKSIDSILDKIDQFISRLAMLESKAAVSDTVLDFMKQEIKLIKVRCRHCDNED